MAVSLKNDILYVALYHQIVQPEQKPRLGHPDHRRVRRVPQQIALRNSHAVAGFCQPYRLPAWEW